MPLCRRLPKQDDSVGTVTHEGSSSSITTNNTTTTATTTATAAAARTKSPRIYRRYQVWQGNNTLLCRGKLVIGPDWKTLFLTLILTISPMIGFTGFVAPYLFIEWLPFAVIPIPAFFLFAFDLITLFITSTMDPGIIPRADHPPNEDENVDRLHVDGRSRQRFKETTVNGRTFKMKFCYTCNHYRPPRCSHCSICNNCVDMFDHHCPWTGTCIGERNYRFFYSFLTGITATCIYIIAVCAFTIFWIIKSTIDKNISRPAPDIILQIIKFPWLWASGVLILYATISLFSVGGLWTFHTYLIFLNQTTHEEIKKRWKNKKNPYSRGPILNWIIRFCYRIPKSKLHLNEIVTPESSSPPMDIVRMPRPEARIDVDPILSKPSPNVMATTSPLSIDEIMSMPANADFVTAQPALPMTIMNPNPIGGTTATTGAFPATSDISTTATSLEMTTASSAATTAITVDDFPPHQPVSNNLDRIDVVPFVEV